MTSRRFSLVTFGVALLVAVAVLFAGESPQSAAPEAAVEKASQSSQDTPVSCVEQEILRSSMQAKVTGTKPDIVELARFDFKIDQRVKTLEGYRDVIDHVPLGTQSRRSPT